MLKKIIVTVLFIAIGFCGSAQKELNNYKYILIPKSFEFSNSEDQYQLNSLLKFLFNKHGYVAFFGDELPEDLKNNRCLALKAEVSDEKGSMFKTKLEIILKDCYDATVITSQIGETREKEFKKAYHEALRDAFETFQNFEYKFVAKGVKAKAIVETPKEEKEQVKESIKVKEKETTDLPETKIKETEIEIKTEVSKSTTSEIFYAQAISNGFQLVNSEPRIVMVLLISTAKDVYIVKDKNAIVFKKEGKWFYSENDGNSTSEEILIIKF